MARIRTIKPEFWTDPDIVAIPMAARLFFIGCWNHADDYGVLKDEPERIRLQVMPMDDVDAAGIVDELVRRDLLQRRVAPCGAPVLVIRTFAIHQKIDKRAAGRYGHPETFTMPVEQEPPGQTGRPASTTQSPPIPPHPTPGMEGKGGEGKGGDEPTCAAGAALEKAPTRSRRKVTSDPHFDRFYAAYPRPRKPLDARKAWDAAVKMADPEVIIEAAGKVPIPAGGITYVPYPATWLRAGAWMDEVRNERPLTLVDRNREAIRNAITAPPVPYRERMAAASAAANAIEPPQEPHQLGAGQ